MSTITAIGSPVKASPKNKRRLILVALILAAVTAVAFGVKSSAQITDSAPLAGNLVSIDTYGAAVTKDGTNAFVKFNVTDMAPGAYTYQPLTVAATGALNVRYSITSMPTAMSTATGGIQDGTQEAKDLTIAIKGGMTAAQCSAENVADHSQSGDANWTGGTTILAPKAGGLATATPALNTAVNVLGDPTQGNQAGDRTVNSGSSETLCLQIALPLSALNPDQGASDTFTFTVASEQANLNP